MVPSSYKKIGGKLNHISKQGVKIHHLDINSSKVPYLQYINLHKIILIKESFSIA